jgi:glycosyltransferase involved in cell wall biosynthesis
MRVLVFGKHLLGVSGGAEKSIIAYVRQKYSNDHIIFAGFYNNNLIHPLHKGEEIADFALPVFLKHVPILDFFMFKRSVIKKIKSLNVDHLIIYGFYSPVVRDVGSELSTEIHLRSETDLGIFANYSFGLRRVMKSLLTGFFKPLEFRYQHLLRIAFNSCNRIVANSNFMRDQLMNRYSEESEVVFPATNLQHLDSWEPKYIVMVGNEVVKGFRIFKALSRLHPKEEFRAFCKGISTPLKITPNLTLLPWAKEPSSIFKEAKVILVPSQWLEAYGRVAREAHVLKIPVIVSEVGGLPEAVSYDVTKMVHHYQSVHEWSTKLQNLL